MRKKEFGKKIILLTNGRKVILKLLKKDCLKVFLFVLISKSQIEKKLFKVNVLKKLSNLISVVVLRERINIIRTGNNIKIDKTVLIV